MRLNWYAPHQSLDRCTTTPGDDPAAVLQVFLEIDRLMPSWVLPDPAVEVVAPASRHGYPRWPDTALRQDHRFAECSPRVKLNAEPIPSFRIAVPALDVVKALLNLIPPTALEVVAPRRVLGNQDAVGLDAASSAYPVPRHEQLATIRRPSLDFVADPPQTFDESLLPLRNRVPEIQPSNLQARPSGTRPMLNQKCS